MHHFSENNNLIAGITPFTTIDYPGELAAVLFVRGCPLRCRYCHNPSLLSTEGDFMPDNLVFEFLEQHKGKLSGIVLSGGDPLLAARRQLPGINELIAHAHAMEYKVKLDTNGVCYTEYFREEPYNRGKQLIASLDYIGLDIKAPADKYGLFQGSPQCFKNVQAFIDDVLESGVPVEVRTTVHKSLLDERDLVRIKEEIIEPNGLGDRWWLQQFHEGELHDNAINKELTYSDIELTRIATELGCRVRGVKEE